MKRTFFIILYFVIAILIIIVNLLRKHIDMELLSIYPFLLGIEMIVIFKLNKKLFILIRFINLLTIIIIGIFCIIYIWHNIINFIDHGYKYLNNLNDFIYWYTDGELELTLSIDLFVLTWFVSIFNLFYLYKNSKILNHFKKKSKVYKT